MVSAKLLIILAIWCCTMIVAKEPTYTMMDMEHVVLYM